jgi:signal transduction histidine kinase
MRDESGRIVRLVGSSRDVTRQVQAEEALRQAQKMEAVGQLTGGIAHDFNNLLGAVMGGFDLIRRRADDPERVRRLAESGLEAAERGARLTSQLLTFSRSQRLELKPLIVSDLVRNLGDLLARTLGPMIQLRFDLEAEQQPVLSDPTQLEMAVLNLAINARDAMPDGGTLTLATRRRMVEGDAELAPGCYVELEVGDTGVGMAPEVAARALDPFFTTKGVGKGTGLGLSQVYGMARQPAAPCGSKAGRGRARSCASCYPAPTGRWWTATLPRAMARSLPGNGR